MGNDLNGRSIRFYTYLFMRTCSEFFAPTDLQVKALNNEFWDIDQSKMLPK